MHIRRIFFICLFALPGWMAAQTTVAGEPDPNAMIAFDKTPYPLNVDSVRKAVVYPPFALNARMEGKVILRVLFDESGKYLKHIVVKDPSPMLTQAAEKQAPYLRFEIGTQGGRAVKYWVTIPFDFRLPYGEIESRQGSREIGPNDFMMLEKEPVPINLDQVKLMIGYPAAAKAAEIEGKVIVRVLVDTSGNYVTHVIIKNPHPFLTNAVIAKLDSLHFQPGIQAGKPIKVWLTIPFDFRLLRDEINAIGADRRDQEIGPNDFIKVEKEPVPLNLEEVKAKIGYPQDAKDAGMQGKVIVRVLSDENGAYLKYVVVKDPNPLLTMAVLAEIKALKFTPAIQNGKPIKCWVTVPFDFVLPKKSQR